MELLIKKTKQKTNSSSVNVMHELVRLVDCIKSFVFEVKPFRFGIRTCAGTNWNYFKVLCAVNVFIVGYNAMLNETIFNLHYSLAVRVLSAV